MPASRVRMAVEHRVNFGDYEGTSITASVERDCDEGDEQNDLARVAELLHEAVAEHLLEAAKFAVESSYVHEWKE
jgi:hypothetical protein